MDTANTGLIEELRRARERRTSVEHAELAAIQAARSAGLSWSRIAEALGLRSRQAAEQRLSRLLDRAVHVPAETRADTHRPAVPAAPTGTRGRIILAAATVLTERGYVSSRMADIAEIARLKPGSIYHYFASKDDLVAEVLRYGVQVTHRHVQAVLDDLPADAPALARIDAAMSAHVVAVVELNAVARAHPHVYAQVPAAVREQLRPYRRAYGDLWARVVRQARDAGVLRSDIDEFVLRLFLVNSLEAVNQWSTRSHLPYRELSRVVRRMLMEGVKPTAADSDDAGVSRLAQRHDERPSRT